MIAAGKCLIDGNCSNDASNNPSNICQYCDTLFSQTMWRNKSDGTGCNDDNACTQLDTCFSGECSGSNPVVCDPPEECKEEGVCNTASGLCEYADASDDTPCDDVNSCTQTDTCQEGECEGADPVVCDPPAECKEDGVCNQGTGLCEYGNLDDNTGCDDGNPNTGNDKCLDGICLGEGCNCSGTNDCCDGCFAINEGGSCPDDEITCTDDLCSAGECTHPPKDGKCLIEGSCYNDSNNNPENECQYCDTIFSQSAWRNKNDDTECNDDNICTQADSCQDGLCEGTDPVICDPPAQCKQEGECNPENGNCEYANSDNGINCNDDNECTQTDSCFEGQCTGSDDVVCAPLNQCHEAGICDTGSGECSNPVKADGSGCDDEDDVCTLGDRCEGGVCVGDLKDQDEDTFIDGECGGNDCNDDDDEIHPGHDEWCDGKDNNCLLGIDEGCADCTDENYNHESYNVPSSYYLPPQGFITLNRYQVTFSSLNLLAVEGQFYRDSGNNGTGTFHAVVYADDEGLPGEVLGESSPIAVTAFYPDFTRFDLTDPVAFMNDDYFWVGFVYETDENDSNSFVTLLLDDGIMTSEQNGIFYWPESASTEDPDEGWYSAGASWIMRPIGCAEGPDIRFSSYSVLTRGPFQAGASADIEITLENVGVEDSLALSATLIYDDDAITISQDTAAFGPIAQAATGVSLSPFSLEFSSAAAGQYFLWLVIDDGANVWQDVFDIFVDGIPIECAPPYDPPTGDFINDNASPMYVLPAQGDAFANPYPLQADFTLMGFLAAFYSPADQNVDADYKFRLHLHGSGAPGDVIWESGAENIQYVHSASDPQRLVTHEVSIDTPITFSQGDIFWISVEALDTQSGDNIVVPIFDDGLDPSLNYCLYSPSDDDGWYDGWTGSPDFLSPMMFLYPGGCEGTRLSYSSHTDNSGNGIDPNETINLTVTIENTGGAEVTGVTGKLTYSARNDITVTNADASFGTVAAESTVEASDPFTIHVDESASEYQYWLNLELNDDAGHSWTDTFLIQLNGGAVDLAPTEFTANLAGSTITYDLTVTNNGEIDCTRPFRMDLYIDLEQPPIPNQITSDWNETVDYLAAGDSVSFNLGSSEASPQGNYASYFQVDTTALVAESDEYNNIAGPEEFTIGESTFVLLDPPIRWWPNNIPVAYYVNQSGEESVPESGVSGDTSDEFAELDEGFQIWEDVAGSLVAFNNAGPTSRDGFDYTDNYNTVSWNDPDNDLGSGILAAALPVWNSQSMLVNGITFKRIVDVDIVFNDDVDFCTHWYSSQGQCWNEFNIRGIAAHEIGHMIGLDHPDVADATMYYATGPCNTGQSTLEDSDKNGIIFIYPDE